MIIPASAALSHGGPENSLLHWSAYGYVGPYSQSVPLGTFAQASA